MSSLSSPAHAGGPATIEFVSRYSTGVFAGSAAEIVAHDPRSQRLFVANASTGGLDILQMSATGTLSLAGTIATSGLASHVRIWDDGVTSTVVASVINANGAAAGSIELFTTAGVFISNIPVGVGPDMVYITSTGLAITANEGQPFGGANPVGSVSIVDLATSAVSHVSLGGFDGQEATLRASGVRIFPGLLASVDLEPEYVAVAPDLTTAYVVCQEQNAVIWVDIPTATATAITPLGTKDHTIPGQGLDASDGDNTINIANWPVRGMYMPDSVVAYEAGGQTYLVTANEGDARTEDARCSGRNLDPTAFPNAATLQANANLGRLFVSTIDGDTDGDGDFDELYCYGGRSFSLFNMSAGGVLAYDSGDEFATVIAQVEPADFNSNNNENGTPERRSDNSGSEPEALIVGTIGNRTFAFIGLERQGGIFVYDITDPLAVTFQDYENQRIFSGDAEAGTAGDLGVEGLSFVKATDSPTGEPLLIAANEVSGTTTVFRIVVPAGFVDCNTNGIDDPLDISGGTSADCNLDTIPDECQVVGNDCNLNSILDACETDTDLDGVIDACDPCPLDFADDSDGDGSCDSVDICPGGDDALDADLDGTPDDCDPDDDNDGWTDLEEFACGTNPLDAASQPTDTDLDGLCDVVDTDDDNDGVVDAQDSNPLDAFTCRDADADGCDDCTSGTDNVNNDGLDTDADGVCNLTDIDDDGDTWSDVDELACGTDPLNSASSPIDTDLDGLCDAVDDDDDNDTVSDAVDSSPLDAFACRDLDGDGCDDCASGVDNPLNDGLDTDSDGICNLTDSDDDGDTFSDVDELACGTDPLNSAEIPVDTDLDGLCDGIDDDDDGDGVSDAADSAPLNAFECRDADADGCDDCASGTDNPSNDGLDTDLDGICNLTDADDDGDTWSDIDELACGTDPLNSADSPIDTDLDGLCDAVDDDDDNDGVSDAADASPLDAFACRDLDGDGCDDCASGTDNPLDDGADGDGDGVCDLTDVCPGFDDAVDLDQDGLPDGCDLCPNDAQNDSDGDGLCADVDPCPIDPLNDSDLDGSCDSVDLCPGFDDTIDCDLNGVPDGCDILGGAPDCDGDGVLDSCQVDCNENGIPDTCDLLAGTADDCNQNGIPDSCDLTTGSTDANGDGILDECQGSTYQRGDSNQDVAIDVSDAISTLAYLFGTATTTCVAAHDFNADQVINIGDVIALLNYIFTGSLVPEAPFGTCGLGSTVTLSCDAYAPCP